MPPTQTKGKAYAQMIDAAEKQGTQIVSATQNMAFTLGRARVTFIGPARTQHTDSRDDGLTLRIDYGETSVVVTGCITSSGEKEIVSSGAAVKCDALIASRGGSGGGDLHRMGGGSQAGRRVCHGEKPRQQRAHSAAKGRGDGLRREGKRRDDALFGRTEDHGSAVNGCERPCRAASNARQGLSC